MIIAIAGRPGAGKSSAASLLKKRGFRVLELSAQIMQLMKEEHKPISTRSVLEEGKTLRRKYGKAAVARLAFEHYMPGANTVFSGLRSKSELDCIRKKLGKKVALIYVSAPDMTRLRRLKKRERTYTRSLMEHRDHEEDKFGMNVLCNNADFIIFNTSSIKSLDNGIGVVLSMIGKSRKGPI